MPNDPLSNFFCTVQAAKRKHLTHLFPRLVCASVGRRDEGVQFEETKCPPDELIKHLFNGFHLLTKTRLARTTGSSGMNLGDKGARVHLRLMLGLRADKRPAWKQLWLPRQKDGDLLKIQPEKSRKKERFTLGKKKPRGAYYEVAWRDE